MATPFTAATDADAIGTDLLPAPPGALTETSPGQTDRVKAILARRSQPATDDPAELPITAVSGITTEEARNLTDEIKADAGTLWDKMTRAYTERAWDVLGYESWDAYCSAEFESLRLRLTREERQDVVCSLSEAGLSTRAIAAVTGASQSTVSRDLSGDSFGSPDDPGYADNGEPTSPVTGTDGKTYANRKARHAAHPLTETFRRRLEVSRAAVNKLHKIAESGKFDPGSLAADAESIRSKIDATISDLIAIRARLKSVGGEDK